MRWEEYRQLDMLIAENLEWREVGYDKIGGEWTGIKRGLNTHAVIPRYSKLECDSGLILDRIAALGWAVTVFTSGWHGKTQIRCCIMRAPGGPVVDVVAETRPLAICRAFVQAMERWNDGL